MQKGPDIVLPCSAKPESECKSSGYVAFCCTRFGSHCAHLEGWWPFTYSWLDLVVPQYFRAILAQIQQKATDQVQVRLQSAVHRSGSKHYMS